MICIGDIAASPFVDLMRQLIRKHGAQSLRQGWSPGKFYSLPTASHSDRFISHADAAGSGIGDCASVDDFGEDCGGLVATAGARAHNGALVDCGHASVDSTYIFSRSSCHVRTKRPL